MRVPLYTVEVPSAGGKVSILARPRGGDWLLDEMKALRESGVDILASLLTPEEVDELALTEEATCCASQEMRYLSFPIADFSVPPFSEETFGFLRRLEAELAPGKHIALHCRQGRGRSGLMAACLLVLVGFSPEQALELLSNARGYPVPETEEQRDWVLAFSRSMRSQNH